MNVYIHGSLKTRNFGDELLVILLAKKLKDEFPWIKIFIDANKESLHEIRKFVEVDKIQRKLFLRHMDLIIFGGGGYFGSPSKSRTKWDISFFYRFFPIALIRTICSIDVCVYGVGAGPMPSFVNTCLVKLLLRGALSINVRDKDSSEFFKQHKISTAIVSDIVANKSFFKNHNTLRGNGESYVTLHNVNDLFFIMAVLEIIPRTVPIVVLVDSDRPTDNSLLINHLKRVGRVYQIETFTSTYKVLEVIGGSDFVVTNKLHVGICATTCGVPTIAVPHHLKTIRYYRMFNLSKLVFNSWEEAASSLKEYKSYNSFISSLQLALAARINDYDNLEAFYDITKTITNRSPHRR